MIEDLMRRLEEMTRPEGGSIPLKAPKTYTEQQARDLLLRHKAQSVAVNAASNVTALFWDIEDDRIIGVIEVVVENLDITTVLFTKQGYNRWFGYAGTTSIGPADVRMILDRVEPLAESAREDLAKRARQGEE